MTTPTAIIIAAVIFSVTCAAVTLIGWTLVFRWQQRWLARQQQNRSPWKIKWGESKEPIQ